MLRLRTLLAAAALCCAASFGSLNSCSLTADPSAQCAQDRNSVNHSVNRVSAMRRWIRDHQQEKSIAYQPIAAAIPPLNLDETIDFQHLSHMRTSRLESRSIPLLDPEQQREFNQFQTRIHEFEARRSQPNAECVEHFRHTMAQERDYSWTEAKVQQYIREYAKYVAEQDPQAAAVLPPLDSPELCRATLHHALQVRHDRHVTLSTTLVGSARRMIELEAHREFHAVIKNYRHGRILSSPEVQQRLNEMHAWEQYLADHKRMGGSTHYATAGTTAAAGGASSAGHPIHSVEPQAQMQTQPQPLPRAISPHRRHPDQGHPF